MPDFDWEALALYIASIPAPVPFAYLTDDEGNFLTDDNGVFLIVDLAPEPPEPPMSTDPQPGQKVLTTGLPGIASPVQGGMGIDNGGPVFTMLPVGGGTVVLNGATPVVVADARVKAGSIIVFTLKTVGGTVSPTAPNILTITPGTGFTVGGVALDTSTYNYAILG